jgi:hypothetical protein
VAWPVTCEQIDDKNTWLVVTGTMEFYDFPYIGNFIIPTDELIFFRGVGIPPTRFLFQDLWVYFWRNII